MGFKIYVSPKEERNHWPSIPRPDIKPPLGWDISLLTGVNRLHNHNLSPNGQWIAFIWDRDDLSDVYQMPTNGNWPSRITTNRPLFQYWWEEIPQWSPDSRWLAFCNTGQVYITPASGGLAQKITDFGKDASAPIWMPDSQRIIFCMERNEANKLFITDRNSSWPRALTTGSGDDLDARPSPDGKDIVYVHKPINDLNRWEIRLIELENLKITPLTGAPEQKDWSPRWSPDGKQIAFLSQRSGFNEIWLISWDGEGCRQLTQANYDLSDIAWSPDGKSIACTINRGGIFDLILVDSKSGSIVDLKNKRGVYSHPVWDPTNSWLIVEYSEPGLPPDLYKIHVSGRIEEKLTFSNLPALEKMDMSFPEQITYQSFDQLEIPALLFTPAKPNGALIVHPHGGPRDQYIYEWDIFTQYLLAKGYTFLAINYRGSTGYGTSFEHLNQNDWGKGDTQDCIYAAKYAQTLPWIDPSRIAIFGGSYGGYMVACSLSRDPEYHFACGVCLYGDTDLFSSWALCERATRLYTEMQLGHPAAHRKEYYEGSPIYQVENIQKPLLILHGLEDDVVPPQASEEWVEALRRTDKTFEYKTYARETHGFLRRENVQDVYVEIEQFLDWYLFPPI